MDSRDLLVVAESSSGPSPQTQPSASTDPVSPVRAANVSVVHTAEELQSATQNGAIDIEIQSHLDLSTLDKGPNPRPPRADLSLLYADTLRSVRGNCSDPDAAGALGLPPQEELLPLKPRQCLILLRDTLLTVLDEAIWIDNLYLKAHHEVGSSNEMTFIRAGVHHDTHSSDYTAPSRTFITNTTFQAVPSRSYQALSTGFQLMRVYISECIFSRWRGFQPPLAGVDLAVLNIVDTVFHDVDVSTEIVDVSWGGIVRFQAVRFVGVPLAEADRQIVGTSLSDYEAAPFEYGVTVYFPEDDEEFDVRTAPVPAGAGGPFGAERWIAEGVMSNCVFLKNEDGERMPGCPGAADEARAAVRARALEYAAADAYSAAGPSPAEYESEYDDGEVALLRSGELRLASRLSDQTSWFVLVREMLGELPPPPANWPDFESSLPLPRAAPVEPDAHQDVRLWAPFSPTASAPPAPPAQAAPADTVSEGRPLAVSISSGVAVAVVLAALAALWAVLRHRQKRRAQGEEVDKAARQAGGRLRSRSGSGHSALSVVQSRKVEVPETTQMFISTGNTTTVLGPGFTAHAQGSAAWSERSDSPLATDHYLPEFGKPPIRLELPLRRKNSQSATLPAQTSLPSAARSASTEPASHSAGSDAVHGPMWASCAPAGNSSCISPDRTLSGGCAHWTSPAVLLNTGSGGMQKSLSGGSPGGHQGGFLRGDSLQETSEIASSRGLQGSSEVDIPHAAAGAGANRPPFSTHPAEMAAPGGSAFEAARIQALYSHAPAALCRANSSSSAVMRAPDGVLTLLGVSPGLVLEEAESQQAQHAQHAHHDVAAQWPPGGLAEEAGAVVGTQRPEQHTAQRAQHTYGHACNAVQSTLQHRLPDETLPPMGSLGCAWEHAVGQRHVAEFSGASSGENAQHSQHAGGVRIPYAEGMDVVAQSATVDGGDDPAPDASGGANAADVTGGPSTTASQARAGDSAEVGGPPARGIAAQWHDLRRSLRGSRGRAGAAAWLARPDPAASRPLAPAAVSGAGPAARSGGDEAMRRLAQQLDLFRPGDLFLGRFCMLGRAERRRGGQAIVQFAEGSVDTCAYAVKFFLDQDAFHAELALYAACSFTPLSHRAHSCGIASSGSAALLPHGTPSHLAAPADDASETAELPSARTRGRFLPVVEAVCGAGEELVDPRGRPLPPCIVMEKGESLYDWSERAEPDLFTSLAVLSNISARMADMHAAGYVHRDLKPANVMWLPRENRWTVIDFGCAARVGEMARLSFTLAFAAPEVVHAYEAGQRTILASPALDAWSLGIMAFELLTGLPAFRMLTDGSDKVMAQLRGAAPLPWEGEAGTALQRRLGAFKGPVLSLLQRNPAQRVSMRQFHDACMELFASVASVEA